MDNFDKAELSGRALFRTILALLDATDIKEASDKYDSLDMSFTLKNKLCGSEIKKRDIKFEHYPTYMMELYKYNALVLRYNKGEFDGIYYVNFFANDTCYIFSLHRIAKGIKDGTVKVTSTYANKTTAVFSGKTEKAILLIPKEIGTKLIRIENKWYNANKL